MDSSHKELGLVGVTVLAAATFVVSLGYGALIPVLPGWLMTLEPSNAATIAKQVGELSGIYMLGVFVGALTAGHLSDRIGRRPVLLAGLGVFLAVLLATVHVGALGALYALRFLAGLSGAAVIPVSAALVSAGSLPADAPSRLAYLGAASLLGFLVGPGIISLPQVLGLDVRWGVSGPIPLCSVRNACDVGTGNHGARCGTVRSILEVTSSVRYRGQHNYDRGPEIFTVHAADVEFLDTVGPRCI